MRHGITGQPVPVLQTNTLLSFQKFKDHEKFLPHGHRCCCGGGGGNDDDDTVYYLVLLTVKKVQLRLQTNSSCIHSI
jgi:hypothetical protein